MRAGSPPPSPKPAPWNRQDSATDALNAFDKLRLKDPSPAMASRGGPGSIHGGAGSIHGGAGTIHGASPGHAPHFPQHSLFGGASGRAGGGYPAGTIVHSASGRFQQTPKAGAGTIHGSITAQLPPGHGSPPPTPQAALSPAVSNPQAKPGTIMGFGHAQEQVKRANSSSLLAASPGMRSPHVSSPHLSESSGSFHQGSPGHPGRGVYTGGSPGHPGRLVTASSPGHPGRVAGGVSPGHPAQHSLSMSSPHAKAGTIFGSFDQKTGQARDPSPANSAPGGHGLQGSVLGPHHTPLSGHGTPGRVSSMGSSPGHGGIIRSSSGVGTPGSINPAHGHGFTSSNAGSITGRPPRGPVHGTITGAMPGGHQAGTIVGAPGTITGGTPGTITGASPGGEKPRGMSKGMLMLASRLENIRKSGAPGGASPPPGSRGGRPPQHNVSDHSPNTSASQGSLPGSSPGHGGIMRGHGNPLLQKHAAAGGALAGSITGGVPGTISGNLSGRRSEHSPPGGIGMPPPHPGTARTPGRIGTVPHSVTGIGGHGLPPPSPGQHGLHAGSPGHAGSAGHPRRLGNTPGSISGSIGGGTPGSIRGAPQHGSITGAGPTHGSITRGRPGTISGGTPGSITGGRGTPGSIHRGTPGSITGGGTPGSIVRSFI